MVVYDVTDRESFEGVKNWIQEIEKYAQENVIKILGKFNRKGVNRGQFIIILKMVFYFLISRNIFPPFNFI